MDTPQPKSSPFPPADQVPLHRVAPLAPSQELAYRRKCIQLRRRLTEIEANNDATKRRIDQEKNHINKMRLIRAILLNHLKELMNAPSRKLSKEELSKLANGDGPLAEKVRSTTKQPHSEELLDESTDETEDEIPEPQERPTRFRRTGNAPNRESSGAVVPPGPAPYQQSTLPSLAPAASFSPDIPREPSMLTSTFRLNSSGPTPPHPQAPLQYPAGQYGYQPTHPITPYTPASPAEFPQQQPAVLPPPPERPAPPFEQFTAHMIPQLEADNYPQDQIQPRIEQEWRHLSDENRNLWIARYEDQMREYQIEKDHWERERRTFSSMGSGVNGLVSGPPIAATGAETGPPLQPRGYPSVSG